MDSVRVPKPEPQDVAMAVEDDAFEDTGELEMPKQLARAWLARVPRFLYDNWAKCNDDEPVQIGVLRQYKNSKRQRLLLDRGSKYNRRIPIEYDLKPAEPLDPNTFVFSEKDLPASKRRQDSQESKDNILDPVPGGVDKSQRFRGYRTRTVPKQTTLIAAINNELVCSAVDNTETKRIMQERRAEEEANAPKMNKMTEDIREIGSLNILGERVDGRLMAAKDTPFNITGRRIALNRPKKTQQNKYVRLPTNELLDLLYDCFKQYRYWPFDSLRTRTQQPSEHLRTNLEKVADMVKSGPHHGLWRLKPEMAATQDVQLPIKEEVAPKVDVSDDDSLDDILEIKDDDDDEDTIMEDVKMGVD